MKQQNPIFIPGPTNIPDWVRRAIDLQTTDHRAPDFKDFMFPMMSNLKTLLELDAGEIFIFPSSGTGGWEASIANILSPGDKVLAARHGMFSRRWIDLCEHFGLDVEIIEQPWGESASAQAFAERLAADTDHQIKAVLATHNETATGVRSDLPSVRAAIDAVNHPALFMVDGVSSIASMEFRMSAWGIDVAVTGSQKGFMLPTGLAIVAVSEKAYAHIESAKLSRYFFDFKLMKAANSSGGFPYTPPIQLMRGLDASLKELLAEGMDQVAYRHYRIAEGVRRAADAWGMKLVSTERAAASDTVTTIAVPEGFDAGKLTDHIFEKYEVSFGVGLGPLAGKVFRFGHLGLLSDVTALSGLATLEMGMADLGYPIELGKGLAAAQEWYRNTPAIAVV